MKKNILANYIGQFWSALMTVGFIPIYIAKLGPESFGLIGVLTTLQACFSLMDLGMTPLIGREMARYVGGQHAALHVLSLLRSIEIVALAVATLTLVTIYTASGWLATNWLNPVDLQPSAIAGYLTLMGAIVGLRLLESIYRAVLTGLQRNITLNCGIVLVSTLRGLGSVAVLVFVEPTIRAFLFWQLVCSIIAVVVFALLSYRHLPKPERAIAFDPGVLKTVWRFAAGMSAINILALVITQADKIILAKLLALADFGTYALAATIATIPQILIAPVIQAVQPQLTMQVAAKSESAFAASFHLSAQLTSVLMGAAAIVLMVFSSLILSVWFQSGPAPTATAHLVTILALGNLLNGLMQVPFVAQLAHGWTRLAVKSNIVAALVLLPALVWIVPHYGAIGAAWIWVALNCGFFVLQSAAMFRRILSTEKWPWLLNDIARPLAAATAVALTAKQLQPTQMTTVPALVFLTIAASATLLAAAAAAPSVLHRVRATILAQQARN